MTSDSQIKRALGILRNPENRTKLRKLREKQGGGSSMIPFNDPGGPSLEMIYNPQTSSGNEFYLLIPGFGIVYESELERVLTK